MMFLIISVAIFLLLAYLYGTRNYNYWEKKGIKYEKPIPFLGSAARNIFFRISSANYLTEIYNKYPKEKMVGSYFASERVLVLRDAELVKRVMITDWQYFHARGLNPNKTYIEPLMKNLFHADGDSWKLLRQRLTPAFTSGKLKAMFPLIMERAEKLQIIAKDAAETGKEVDIRELIARYATDFIGACGFGIDSDSLNEEESDFRKLGKRIFEVHFKDAVKFILIMLVPHLVKNAHLFPADIEKNTLSLVKQIMQQRNYKPSGRNDFIDLLLELKQKGNIVGESIEIQKSDGTPETATLVMDDLLMAAQVFIFFAAGFETSSSTSSYTMHLLAFHPEEQKKVQEEIDRVLREHDGKLCYEAIKEMKYLEMCFKESMRILPSLGWLSRVCVRPYKFPGTDLTIDKDVQVHIPVQAMQMDERYFKDPEAFRPERFHPDNINETMKTGVYLPFGQGPRACIGERLGLMQSMTGLAAILSQYSVVPSKSTLRHPIVDPTGTVVQTIKNGLPLKLVAREL